MLLDKLMNDINPFCFKCPYKLGLIKTLINPCIGCKIDGYKISNIMVTYRLRADMPAPLAIPNDT